MPSNTVFTSYLSDAVTPVSAYNALRKRGSYSFLFESADMSRGMGRFSILGVDPALIIRIKGEAALVQRRGGEEQLLDCPSPLSLLEEIQKTETAHFERDLLPDFLPFAGGLVGYLGYGAVASFESIAMQEQDFLQVPDAVFCLYDSCVVFDHLFRRCFVVSHSGAERLDELSAALKNVAAPASSFDLPKEPVDIATLLEGTDAQYARAEFLDKVEECKGLIADGEVFQIVLSQRFSKPCQADALELYRVLQALSPSPYAFLLEAEDFAYLGSSPETFVRVDRAGRATVKALAGTRRRGADRQEDQALAAELVGDPKEKAEHMMLVDLARNDLGRISKAGTVAVNGLCELVRYSHVMHLSSTVRGEMETDKSSFDAVKACFPAGTVSGAPKIRAMEHLARIESERRCIYSGMVGYFDFRGMSDSAIAIRSALLKDGVVHAQAGAGIVFDSKAYAEYRETLNKVRPVLAAVNVAETRRFTNV